MRAGRPAAAIAFFFPASPIIFIAPDSSGYGDKRGRNKPIGPGGSTRRLHHMPVQQSREWLQNDIRLHVAGI